MNSANSPRLQLYTTPHHSLFPASWLTPALFPIAQLGAHSSPLYSTLDRNGSTAADLTRASHKACYSPNMTLNPKKLVTSPILWSLVWAVGILAAAFLFKRNPANYWIESALVVGALTTVVLKAQRPVCSAR
jgi:beta-lactamase regulating signal transducer with metallopeptidase domain